MLAHLPLHLPREVPSYSYFVDLEALQCILLNIICHLWLTLNILPNIKDKYFVFSLDSCITFSLIDAYMIFSELFWYVITMGMTIILKEMMRTLFSLKIILKGLGI